MFPLGFKTDAEISRSSSKQQSGVHRELRKWRPAERGSPTAGSNLTAGLGDQLEDWDQFEVNARRFKVKSTYREDLYTTPLDVSAIPLDVRDKADQIAREIEASQQDLDRVEGLDEEYEEAQFAAVRGACDFRFDNGNQQKSGAAHLPWRASSRVTKPSLPVAPSPAVESSRDNKWVRQDAPAKLSVRKDIARGDRVVSRLHGSSHINALNLEPVLSRATPNCGNMTDFQKVKLDRSLEKQKFVDASKEIKEKMEK